MNRYILLIVLAISIAACNSNANKPMQETKEQKDMVLEYLAKVQDQSIDSSLTYCILYFADNCTLCNAPSEPIIDSILSITNSSKQIIITTKKEHIRPIFYQPHSRLIIDTANMLGKYGIIYPRHMLLVYRNQKIKAEIEIIEDNKHIIDSVISNSPHTSSITTSKQ